MPNTSDSEPCLPEELLDIIISLIPEDNDSLRACSLVCHSFNAITRPHTFRRIKLIPSVRQFPETDHTGTVNTCRHFYHLLTRSPEIARLVRELHVTDTHYKGRADQHWILEEETLPLVLRALSSLRSLHIAGGEARWKDISAALGDSLRPLFSSAELTNVSFSSITFLPGFAPLMSLFDQRSTPLQRLSLVDLRFEDSPQGKVASRHQQLHIDSLVLCTKSIYPFLKWARSHHSTISIESLRTVTVHDPQHTNFRAIPGLLKYITPFVEHVQFNIAGFGKLTRFFA